MSIEGVVNGIQRARDTAEDSVGHTQRAKGDALEVAQLLSRLVSEVKDATSGGQWLGMGISLANGRASLDEVKAALAIAESQSKQSAAKLKSVVGESQNVHAQGAYVFGDIAAQQLNGDMTAADTCIPHVVARLGEDIHFTEDHLKQLQELGNSALERLAFIDRALVAVEEAQDVSMTAMRDTARKL